MNKFNTIAIDLAKNVFQVCILSPDRTIIQNKQVTRAKLASLLANQNISIVAMEVCYSSHYWARVFFCYGA